MLLSLQGIPREEKARHRGAEMALAVARLPGQSKVFRKFRRGSDLEDTRPDYQDLLVDLTLWVWLRKGEDPADPPLSARVAGALADPATINRSGGLSLGEGSHLIDRICIDPDPPDRLIFLLPDVGGFYSLPVWVDHLARSNTVFNRFRLSDPLTTSEGLATAWTRIGGKS
jgi:CRISPR-associated protein Cas5t